MSNKILFLGCKYSIGMKITDINIDGTTNPNEQLTGDKFPLEVLLTIQMPWNFFSKHTDRIFHQYFLIFW
jgi:hypothetical protein